VSAPTPIASFPNSQNPDFPTHTAAAAAAAAEMEICEDGRFYEAESEGSISPSSVFYECCVFLVGISTPRPNMDVSANGRLGIE